MVLRYDCILDTYKAPIRGVKRGIQFAVRRYAGRNAAILRCRIHPYARPPRQLQGERRAIVSAQVGRDGLSGEGFDRLGKGDNTGLFFAQAPQRDGAVFNLLLANGEDRRNLTD